MLPARVFAPLPPIPTVEDIFATGLSILFTDDTQNSHGLPGQSVIYTSPKFGEIKLGIPAHPDLDEGRRLFAHYLWNAGVLAADAIETASIHDDDDNNSSTTTTTISGTIANESKDENADKVKWDKKYWDFRNRDVLELGAGTALPSLISGLSGAHSLTITDHPTSPALLTDTIARNVLKTLKIDLMPPPRPSDVKSTTKDSLDNATSPQQSSTDPHPNPPLTQPHSTVTVPLPRQTCSRVSIHGLTWGTPTFTSPTKHGKISDPQPQPASFDKIIVSDCLWMPSQHANLVKTISTYLRRVPPSDAAQAAGSMPCALVVAGFHTGRHVVARFFRIATGNSAGRGEHVTQGEKEGDEEEDEDDGEDEREVKGSLRAAEMIEVDVDRNVRAWLPERPGESREQAKRWCICAALVKT